MSPPDAPADKRRATRTVSPKVVVRIPSVDRFRSHYLNDISEGGLFVKADKVLPPGFLLTLELWPPNWDHALEISAKVTRSADAQTAALEGVPSGMAVQFVNVPPEITRQLEALVDEHRQEAAADPVGSQVKSLVKELSAARDRVGQLEAQLLELRGEKEAFAAQLETLEREEAEARAGAAKLAEERSDLERKLREANGELEDLRREAEGATRKLEAEKAESRRWRQRADQLASDLDRRDSREKELRKLLDRAAGATSADSGGDEGEEIVVVSGLEGGDVPAGKPRTKPPEPDDDSPVRTTQVLYDPTPQGKARSRSTPPPEEAEVRSTQVLYDPTPRGKAKSMPPPPPPDVVGSAKAGASTEFDVDFGDEADIGLGDEPPPEKPEPADDLFDELSPKDQAAFDAFASSLGPRSRIVARDGLADREPGSDDEKLVIELIGASPTYRTLTSQVEGKLDEEKLKRVLFALREHVDVR